jgi:hypothetical protein
VTAWLDKFPETGAPAARALRSAGCAPFRDAVAMARTIEQGRENQ